MHRILLIFLVLMLLYYLSKLFFRYVFPWLLRKFIERQTGERMDGGRKQKKRPPKQKEKIIPDDKGEYVDYEEVNDK